MITYPDATVVTPPPPPPIPIYDFGTVNIGSFQDGTFIVRNAGIAGLRISSVNSPAPPFSIQSNGCTGQNIAPGATCNIVVRFRPTALPLVSSQFSILSNDPDTPVLTIPIQGTGHGAPNMNVNPLSINFGNVQVSQTAHQTITVTSNGTLPLTISSITSPAPPFSIVHNCPLTPLTLTSPGTCQITVTYGPLVTGANSSSIDIVSDGGSATVSLSGNGVTTPDISVSPPALNFPSTSTGSTSSQNLTVTNNGTAPLTISGFTNPANPEFAITFSDCVGTLPAIPAPLASRQCTITIAFSPLTAGFKQTSFNINSNDPDTPAYPVFLTGTGAVVPDINVSPLALNFGGILVGQTSAVQTITVSNTGSGSLVITGITGPSDPSYIVTSNTCLGASLGAGGTCQISVRFAPTGTGPFPDTIVIASNDPDPSEATVTVNLSGSDRSGHYSAIDLSDGLWQHKSREHISATDSDSEEHRRSQSYNQFDTVSSVAFQGNSGYMQRTNTCACRHMQRDACV